MITNSARTPLQCDWITYLGRLFLNCHSMGLDLLKGTVRNNLEAGVIEPAMSKVKILQVEFVYTSICACVIYIL